MTNAATPDHEARALELDPPVMMASDASVADVIEAMRRRRLGYALITEQEKLVGIFTERDVLLDVLDKEEVLHQPVAVQMTADPKTIRETERVGRVASLMHETGFRQIPIVDRNNRVLGCVRHKDIAEYLVSHFPKHILNLPPDPERIATTPDGG